MPVFSGFWGAHYAGAGRVGGPPTPGTLPCVETLPLRDAEANLALPAGVPELLRVVFAGSPGTVTQGWGPSTLAGEPPYLGYANFHAGLDLGGADRHAPLRPGRRLRHPAGRQRRQPDRDARPGQRLPLHLHAPEPPARRRPGPPRRPARAGRLDRLLDRPAPAPPARDGRGRVDRARAMALPLPVKRYQAAPPRSLAPGGARLPPCCAWRCCRRVTRA